MRNPSWRLAAAVSLLAAAAAPAQAPGIADAAKTSTDAARPRSVVFYLMDTCRHDRVSYDGYSRQTTPFLEWLAERSVVFESCYSQAPWTKPSMASMLSSQYPSATGIHRIEQRLPDAVLTWPEVLQANGTYTAGFSANIVMGNILSNFAQGFDHFTESTVINNADPIRFASGSAKSLNRHVFPWLDRTDHWPMLLYLHSVDPHEEYEPEPDYLKQFADPERHPQFRDEWDELLDSRPPIPGLYVTQDNFDRTNIDAASFIEHASNLYDADILANDDQMQRLWDKLQEDGWGEDFIFVFTSDHGEEFFEHGGTCHGYGLYDETVRVPLMIYAPGLLPAGKQIETPVRCLDLYPTLCELLGFDIPAGLQGESLVPLMNGRGPREAPEIYSEHREDPVVRRLGHGSGVMVSLRIGRWKFILNELSSQLIPKPRYELFDLQADPKEQDNLAGANPELVKQFEAKVESFLAEHRRDESVQGVMSKEEEVLAQLRELGYIGEEEEEEEPDIWEAMKSKDPEEVRRCLEAGANANQLEEVLGTSPLFMAAAAGELELAKALLEGGAEIDLPNKDGTTPLIGAAFLGRLETAKLLLEKGADCGVVNVNGDTALIATQHGWEITSLVMQMLGLSFEQEEVEQGRAEIAKLLVK